MLYLEDYLECIEHLPHDLRDRFTEMRELDLTGRVEAPPVTFPGSHVQKCTPIFIQISFPLPFCVFRRQFKTVWIGWSLNNKRFSPNARRINKKNGGKLNLKNSGENTTKFSKKLMIK